MSSHQVVVNALKSDAVWFNQMKHPILSQHLHGLWKAYMKKLHNEWQRIDTGLSNLSSNIITITVISVYCLLSKCEQCMATDKYRVATFYSFKQV